MKRLSTIITVYRWPIMTVAVVVALCVFGFGLEFFQTLWTKLIDEDWLADNLLSYVIFGIFISWIVSLHQGKIQKQREEPFQGWELVICGRAQDYRSDIFWRDVEEFLDSDFSMWKFVKSCLSSYCQIKTPTLQEAKMRWLSVPAGKSVARRDRTIVIDLDKMTDQDVRVWYSDAQ